MPALGVAASSFVCSSAGPNGVCQGAAAATQRVFAGLQTEINRAGRSFGITRIEVDGKIGPRTVSALLMLANRLSAKLGGALDRSLDVLLIEVEGSPTTPRDIALNAEALTAALQRDGAAETPWSVVTAVQTAATQFVDNVVSAAQSPAPPTPTPTPPAPAAGGALINPYGQPAPPLVQAGLPLGLKIGLGLTAAAIVGGVVAALARPRREPRVAGVGCSCHR